MSVRVSAVFCTGCTSTDLQLFRNTFWLPAAGVHTMYFMLVHMFQNLLAEQIGGAVGGSAGQDVAVGAILLYLLYGLHQGHSFTFTHRTIIENSGFLLAVVD